MPFIDEKASDTETNITNQLVFTMEEVKSGGGDTGKYDDPNLLNLPLQY